MTQHFAQVDAYASAAVRHRYDKAIRRLLRCTPDEIQRKYTNGVPRVLDGHEFRDMELGELEALESERAYDDLSELRRVIRHDLQPPYPQRRLQRLERKHLLPEATTFTFRLPFRGWRRFRERDYYRLLIIRVKTKLHIPWGLDER
jgi:hypothetical protein